MSLEKITLVYLVVSVLFLNTAWVKHLSIGYLIFKQRQFTVQFSEWILRLGVVFYAGYFLDMQYTNAPHQFYSNWQLYGTFLITMAVFTIPGFIYFYVRRAKK